MMGNVITGQGVATGPALRTKELQEATAKFHEILTEISAREKALADREYVLRVETDNLNAKIAKLKELIS